VPQKICFIDAKKSSFPNWGSTCSSGNSGH
jgi:hypothetical protein